MIKDMDEQSVEGIHSPKGPEVGVSVLTGRATPRAWGRGTAI